MRSRGRQDKNDELRKLAMGEAPVSTPTTKMKDELGEVLKYDSNSNSYTIVTRGSGGNPAQPGGRQLQNVARKTVDTLDSSPLPMGTTVVINWDLGFPYIDGVLPINASRKRVESVPGTAATISGEKETPSSPEDHTTGYANAYYRQPGMPKDILPGDKILVTEDGNFVGALRGGYNVMSSGPNNKAKIETFGDRDLVRVTCDNFELYTAFGILEILNMEGRSGISLRGGIDQLTESGGEEEQWTFKLDIGELGDYFTLEINDQGGNTKAKLNITANGHVSWIATDGYDVLSSSPKPSHAEFAGAFIQKVLGKVVESIGQNKNVTVGGSCVTQISQSDQTSIGQSESRTINNEQLLNVGGNRKITISGGSPLEAKPTNIASETQILNGSYHLEVGNVLSGASPLAKAKISFVANNGEISLGQNPKALAPPAPTTTVSLNTISPNSVALGGHTNILAGNPALFHAVKFEPLQTLLTAMVGMIDTHIHPAPYTPPLVPMSAIITPMMVSFMSLRVLIGA
jgi:hypothetical protein